MAFSHRLHQDNNPDCQACHRLFPDQFGAFNRLKQEGKLKSTQAMNPVCIACHRQKRAAGQKARGPSSAGAVTPSPDGLAGHPNT